MSGAVTFIDPVDGDAVPLVYRVGDHYIGVAVGAVKVIFRGDSLDESVDLAESVLRKALDAIGNQWPQ